jgi:DDE superfamily endonuclease
VCFDECPYQLVSEVRQPLPARPGSPEKYDYEYKREGTCNLFLFVQPQSGWRHVDVTDRRTAQDFAHCRQDVVDVHFPQADLIRVVRDNLNTHTLAALYETFSPAEARRIARKREFHYTPKHGSWLNMAEIELAVLSGGCLDRRLPSQDMVRQEVAAWEAERNAAQKQITWAFTTTTARVTLDHLYPALPAAVTDHPGQQRAA